VLTVVNSTKSNGAREILRFRHFIDLRHVDPASIKVHLDMGIGVRPYADRKAFATEVFTNGGISMGTEDDRSYQLFPASRAQDYKTAAAFRELVKAAQDIPEEAAPAPTRDPAAELNELFSGTHWAWYEGEFLAYQPRMKYWVEFYKDGTARVPWRDADQAWKVTPPGTVIVSDPKVGDHHEFLVDVENRSGSTLNRKLHIHYVGRVLKSERHADTGVGDVDAAFTDVKRACAHAFSYDGLTETTELEFDKAKGILTIRIKAQIGNGAEFPRFQFLIDLKQVDPDSIKVQDRRVRLEPYAGKPGFKCTGYGVGGVALPSKDLTYFHLGPEEDTQAPGLAEAFRELVKAVQARSAP
jgi:hypothetical protein